MQNAKHYLERELYDALRRDSKFFDALQGGTLDGIWYWDLEKREHAWVSPRFWELLGFDPAEMRHGARAWQDLIDPDDLEAVQRNLAKHLADPDHPYDQVVRYRHKNGSCVWLRCRGIAIRDASGRPRRMIGSHSDVSELKGTEEDLRRETRDLKAMNSRLSELARAKDELQVETEYLRDHLKREQVFSEIVGRSDVMLATLQKVTQAAATDATVLLLGETGTGKELLARALHARSNRRDRALVRIDCTTLPSALVESELFGHEKGAFTGAHETRVGRFEVADGGTVFLDEVGELSLDLQAKLLRVLQEGEFRRLGSKKERKVDVRIIAATNRDLKEEVRQGRFRSDLYYRLSVFPLESPPLRERREDIPLLASYFLSRFRTTVGKRIDSIAESSMDALVSYDWPGNVRELQNVIGDVAVREGKRASALKRDLNAVEAARIMRALEESDWKVKGEGNAASRLGLKPSTLRSRMKKFGIARPSTHRRS
jgi:PAS domain S-box-containing protein